MYIWNERAVEIYTAESKYKQQMTENKLSIIRPIWRSPYFMYFQGRWRLKYLENNVLQLYIPHNFFFWDDIYSIFCKVFFQAIFEK
jgi:ribosome-associated toxin RatA of RatAB toxin-antitoxin module